jgi:lactoylglutathione lyase
MSFLLGDASAQLGQAIVAPPCVVGGTALRHLALLNEPVREQSRDRPIQRARREPDPALGCLLGETHDGVAVMLSRGDREQDQVSGLGDRRQGIDRAHAERILSGTDVSTLDAPDARYRTEGGTDVITGVSKVVIEVEDQDRALGFWTKTMGFELVEDAPYGDERWLEVRSPDGGLDLVLELQARHGGDVPDHLPTSNVMFRCDDLVATFEELRARGVEFPQAPVEQSFGSWSMFNDSEGNRFALEQS